MIFRNPWIDPRMLQLRPEAVQTYLATHGWENLGPADVPDMLMFDTPVPRRDKANVLLPLKLGHSHQIQRLVELVTEVALYEDRWAVDVVKDMLRQPVEAVPANGPRRRKKQNPHPSD
jgi:hypothetical protein